MDNGDLVDYKHLKLNCMGIYGVLVRVFYENAGHCIRVLSRCDSSECLDSRVLTRICFSGDLCVQGTIRDGKYLSGPTINR